METQTSSSENLSVWTLIKLISLTNIHWQSVYSVALMRMEHLGLSNCKGCLLSGILRIWFMNKLENWLYTRTFGHVDWTTGTRISYSFTRSHGYTSFILDYMAQHFWSKDLLLKYQITLKNQ